MAVTTAKDPQLFIGLTAAKYSTLPLDVQQEVLDLVEVKLNALKKKVALDKAKQSRMATAGARSTSPPSEGPGPSSAAGLPTVRGTRKHPKFIPSPQVEPSSPSMTGKRSRYAIDLSPARPLA
jgi:hypothetical protein